MLLVTRYAKSGDVHVAYQVFGDGPVNLVLAPPFRVEHRELLGRTGFFSLASPAGELRADRHARQARYRHVGVAELPGLDERMDDVCAVLDAVGMDQAALLGISEGGPLTALFAATYPDRCHALVLYD